MTTKEKQQGTFICEDEGVCCPTEPASLYEDNKKKALVEVYVFIDPLCPECWALEPTLKKLQIEYANFISIKTFLGNEMRALNTPCGSQYESIVKEMAKSFNETACRTGMPCDGDVWHENALTTPYTAIMAIKAAELQGKAIGSKYLRRVREALFVHKENIASEDVLIRCASRVNGMDVEEFTKDLQSETACTALKSDIQTAKEMDVDSLPTMVFFSEDVDEPGLKVQGRYDYDVYVKVIEEMAGRKLDKCPPLPLPQFVAFYSVVATKEISVVYDLSIEEANKEMRKLKLQQKVEEIQTKHGSIWRAIG
ncbi:DsbA family protein [Paenalkalicoccus suaedae]|uniref:ClpXP adapter protein SpxH n=1 Tax=Paenalkalicoccus suaedae TaxID=2592382 RepID=A0A859FFZ7_9BACI|nr:ClpXP adapter SpxH family protein [Paenalkalicoccus suaedae]QKS71760.1 DsbA family protein [Paenalkalicoccus suaedae]